MQARRLSRVAAAALLLTAGVWLGASAPATEGPPAAAVDPPPGQLLIASAAIRDPRFHHSVILLVRHDDKGAFGIIINKPLEEKPIADLLAAAEAAGHGKDADKDR